jgi:hypothetical protein
MFLVIGPISCITNDRGSNVSSYRSYLMYNK